MRSSPRTVSGTGSRRSERRGLVWVAGLAVMALVAASCQVIASVNPPVQYIPLNDPRLHPNATTTSMSASASGRQTTYDGEAQRGTICGY